MSTTDRYLMASAEFVIKHWLTVANVLLFLFIVPILLGILCGVSALVPVVGMYIVTVPMFLYILANALITGTFVPNIGYFILMVAAVVIFVQTLPDFVLRPFMARGQVNTGLLMFAYIIGPIVFGIAGLFIGAIVLVLLTHYFRIVVPTLTHAQIEKI